MMPPIFNKAAPDAGGTRYITYSPNPVSNQRLCTHDFDKMTVSVCPPVSGCAFDTAKASRTEASKKGILSIKERSSGRFSTNQSYKTNTAGKVATESFPATANKKRNNDNEYQRLAFSFHLR
jgi:hypothetical protein